MQINPNEFYETAKHVFFAATSISAFVFAILYIKARANASQD